MKGATRLNLQVIKGTLVLPDRLLERGAVVLREGRIAWVGPAATLPSEYRDALVVEAEIVAPGLVDLHLHGSAGCDVMTGQPLDLERLSAHLASEGTTAYLPTTLSAPREILLTVARAVFSQAGDLGPSEESGRFQDSELKPRAEILGLHLEGPTLNPEKAGAHNRRHLRRLDLAEIAEVQEASGGLVRLITLAPELVTEGEVRELALQGVRVSAGHSTATYDQAIWAFEAGVRQVTHLFNAMPPVNHREPGLAGASLDRPGVVVQLILDGVHVHPAMARLAIKAKGPDEVALITDALPLAGLAVGRYEWDGRPVNLTSEAIYLVDGPLAGSRISLLQAVRNAVQLGFSLPEAWRMGATVPARALGCESRKGQLATGCDADILLLTSDLDLTGVLCRGRRVVQADRE